MYHIIASILQNTVIITSFVLVMMLLIEYINVNTKGRWVTRFQGSGFRQILLAAVLGAIPGCLGGFAVVSLFTHNMVSFGALVACLTASFGDEAFAMLAILPKEALLLSAILFATAILAGLATDFFVKRFPAPFDSQHFAIHDSDKHSHPDIRGNLRNNLQHITFERVLLIIGIIALIVFIMTGWLEHQHDMDGVHAGHIHHHDRSFSGILLQERWLNILFACASLFALFIVVTVHEHFLKEHFWEHIIKKHLPKIFLWTLAVLTVLSIGQYFVDIGEWVESNPGYMLALAILIGLIPESGPHLVFITLFASGAIPFSVLLANSIVQEGHAGLPLLAESKKGFLCMKLISVGAGLLAGLAGYVIGF
ncbi:MAG: putative manganese transporter [Bacteroidales bacterium]|jgi:hypothetical protein|nr:putative manganese transporter [Bacteroidales bacterium]